MHVDQLTTDPGNYHPGNDCADCGRPMLPDDDVTYRTTPAGPEWHHVGDCGRWDAFARYQAEAEAATVARISAEPLEPNTTDAYWQLYDLLAPKRASLWVMPTGTIHIGGASRTHWSVDPAAGTVTHYDHLNQRRSRRTVDTVGEIRAAVLDH